MKLRFRKKKKKERECFSKNLSLVSQQAEVRELRCWDPGADAQPPAPYGLGETPRRGRVKYCTEGLVDFGANHRQPCWVQQGQKSALWFYLRSSVSNNRLGKREEIFTFSFPFIICFGFSLAFAHRATVITDVRVSLCSLPASPSRGGLPTVMSGLGCEPLLLFPWKSYST